MSHMSELDVTRREIFERPRAHAGRDAFVVTPHPDKYHPPTPMNTTTRATRDVGAQCRARLADAKTLVASEVLDDSSQVILAAAVHIVELLDGREATDAECAVVLMDGFDLAWEVVYGSLFY